MCNGEEAINALAERVATLLKSNEATLRQALGCEAAGVPPASVHRIGANAVMLVEGDEGDEAELLIVAESCKTLLKHFEGEKWKLADGCVALRCPLSPENAAALQKHFPWCRPSAGPLAMPHVHCSTVAAWSALLDAAQRFVLFPVLTGSLCAAVYAVFRADFRFGFGLGSPPLRSAAAIDRAVAEGVTYFNLDMAAYEVPPARRQPATIRESQTEYSGNIHVLDENHCVEYGQEHAASCARRYFPVLEAAAKPLLRAVSRRPQGFRLNVSFASGAEPTGPQEHFYCLRELRKRGVPFTSMQPQCGDSKDIALFRETGERHALIRNCCGDYRLGGPCRPELLPLYPVIQKAVAPYMDLYCDGICEDVAPEALPALFDAHFRAWGLKER